MMKCHCNYYVNFLKNIGVAAVLALSGGAAKAQIPDDCRQVIVSKTDGWSSFRATMQCYERENAKSPWIPVFQNEWPALLGRKGSAWGRGVSLPVHDKVSWKVEKDGKAPAGVFALGKLYGYAARPPEGSVWPYLQVGPWDAWVDDPKLPEYNKHVRVDPSAVPAWFESQRMRLGDNAYKWLLEIRHNSNPPTAGYGSAIFFHVRRGPDKPTAGCTTMTQSDLEKMIRWLRPDRKPYYVLLPVAEYGQVRKEWKLP